MLDNLKLRLDIPLEDTSRDEKLSLLLSDAQDAVLDYIGRDALPDRLKSVAVELAVIAYNRQGTEGESGRDEGEASYTFIDGLPQHLKDRLKNYPRKARVIGYAPKADANPEV